MNILFTPQQIDTLTVNNRIIVPPMCTYSANDGKANEWHMMHYGSFAASGPGMIIVEATAVEKCGRISPYDLGLWGEEQADELCNVLAAIKKISNVPFAVQLAHAGRKASVERPWLGGRPIKPEQGGWVTVAPSSVPYNSDHTVPKELTPDELKNIVRLFTEAAKRAEGIGFNAIELHSAHGYLLHEFLSPVSNKRTDGYGGTLEGRMKFPLEVFDAVKKSVAIPVGLRLSATDWVDGGWNLEESIRFAHELQQRGCAFLHVSSGGLAEEQKIAVGPGYQTALAAAIRRALRAAYADQSMPVIAVGLITDGAQAENILAAELADMVAIGRAMLYDPRWVWHAAAALGIESKTQGAPQYWRCQPHELKNLFDTGCHGK